MEVTPPIVPITEMTPTIPNQPVNPRGDVFPGWTITDASAISCADDLSCVRAP